MNDLPARVIEQFPYPIEFYAPDGTTVQNLSIIQAFEACNMEYNGHTARVFKNRTGVSPSEYRNLCKAERFWSFDPYCALI